MPRDGRVAPILITGGCGFIGSNLADSLLADGEEVLLFDDLSRPGVEQNLAWLKERHGRRVRFSRASVADLDAVTLAVAEARAVFHLAGQTAVTTSLIDPLTDFEVNARGSINLLEAIRGTGRLVPLIFASTNKVYGALEDVTLIESSDRYVVADGALARFGIGEDRALDFCTPYGCSKGTADQYVLDYATSFGLATTVLRMSCVYGPRQFGTEDQGWVAHFLIRALDGAPICLFGDGKQVRDILHVEDAVRAYRAALSASEPGRARVYNLGGGPRNAVSLRGVLTEIGALIGRPVQVEGFDWRPGDQLYFVSDTRRIETELGWRAEVGWREGVRDLYQWLTAHRRRTAAPKREAGYGASERVSA